MSIIRKIILPVLLLTILASCKDDFTSDSSYRLTYTTDTLSFDTVFTEMLTPTQIVKVYNTTSKDIHISNVSLYTPNSKHYFMVNVNGKSGTHFQNIDLFSGDSIYIFVQLLINELGQDAPMQINEQLRFDYNDNHEFMVLSAIGQDVHLLRKVRISNDTTWHKDKPYLLYDTLTVDEGVSLTIDEGVTVYMHSGSSLEVNGQLLINGSAENLVTFRGDRFDWLTRNTSYDMVNNQWGGIHFTATSTNNHINGAYIRNGSYGIRIDSSEIDPLHPRLLLANSWIHNTQQTLIDAVNTNLYAYNCVFSNGENGGLRLQGGDYRFNHCTIAGFNKGLGAYRYSVVLSNKDLFDDQKQAFPMNATFNNCIVLGSEYELLLNKEDDTEFNYLFNHCLIREGGIDKEELTDEHFRGSKFATKESVTSNFSSLEDGNYQLQLTEISQARAMGDKEVLELFPECQTDKNGHQRVADSLDVGAYKYIPTPIEP